MGRLDVEAGLLYVPVITQTLLALLKERNVNIVEGVDVTGVQQRAKNLHINTNLGEFVTEKLVITAGLGTNDVLQSIDGCAIRFPLIPDRPSQCKYFIPPQRSGPCLQAMRSLFLHTWMSGFMAILSMKEGHQA